MQDANIINIVGGLVDGAALIGFLTAAFLIWRKG